MRFEALEQTLRLRLVSGPVDKKFFFLMGNRLSRTVVGIRGGYARIYLKFIILKNYMHRARAALARALAPRAKVGGMSQL